MSAPSLLKKWQDEVFTFLSKTPAVAGKSLTVVTTTGSEYEAYRSGGRNRFTMDELLRPYQVSAIHSGMSWQTPIVVYGMGNSRCGERILLKELICINNVWRCLSVAVMQGTIGKIYKA